MKTISQNMYIGYGLATFLGPCLLILSGFFGYYSRRNEFSLNFNVGSHKVIIAAFLGMHLILQRLHFLAFFPT